MIKGAQKNISWTNLEFQVLNNTGLIINKWKPNIDSKLLQIIQIYHDAP